MSCTIEQMKAWKADGHSWAEMARRTGVKSSTLRNRWMRAKRRGKIDGIPARPNAATSTPPPPAESGRLRVASGADGVTTYEVAGAKTLGELADACQVDLDAHEVVGFEHNTWPTTMKGPDGEPVAVVNWQTKARFRPLPPWLQRGPIEPGIALPPPPPVPRRVPDSERVVVVPDIQVGFTRERDGTLVPMHDRAAVDLALQAIAATQPSTVVWLGDNIDAAEMGSYRTPMEHFDTIDAALHELHFIYERARLACQSARHHVLEGNHDDRVERMLMDRARQVQRIRRVGSERPIASMPELLGLDALGIDYHGPYGDAAGDFWLWPDLPCRTLTTHGRVVGNGGGLTASKLLKRHDHSVWQGHTHRAEMARRTVWGPDGARIITAASPGCLCRIDGAVPSVNAREDWQQALGTITRVGEQAFHALHHIDAGRLLLDGQLYQADAGRYLDDLRARWPGFAWGS